MLDEQQMGLDCFIPILTHSFIFVILPYMPTWSVIIVDVPNCEHVHSFTCLFLNDYYLLKCNKLKVFNRSCSKFTSPW